MDHKFALTIFLREPRSSAIKSNTRHFLGLHARDGLSTSNFLDRPHLPHPQPTPKPGERRNHIARIGNSPIEPTFPDTREINPRNEHERRNPIQRHCHPCIIPSRVLARSPVIDHIPLSMRLVRACRCPTPLPGRQG